MQFDALLLFKFF